MGIFSKDIESENKKRLRRLLNSSMPLNCPKGWEMKTFAIGGLTEVGFSINQPEILLVISSQGRGTIDCSKFEKIDRSEDILGDWVNYQEMWALGIGIVEGEKINIAGLHGGGLPYRNIEGDGIQSMPLDWPIIDLVFEPKFESIYSKKDSENCVRIFRGFELRAYGFSRTGNSFVTATSSEVNIYRRI